MTPERASKAVQSLIDGAAEYGAAKADVVRTESMVKITKHLIMARSDAKTQGAKETEAYTHDAYAAKVEEHVQAVNDYETLRAKRDAWVQTIEAWRSMNANQRAAERGYGSHR